MKTPGIAEPGWKQSKASSNLVQHATRAMLSMLAASLVHAGQLIVVEDGQWEEESEPPEPARRRR
jgi:hypothetical protein